MRDGRRERDRYPRASLREQLGNELSALLGNTPLVVLLLVLVGGWLVLTFTRPEVSTWMCAPSYGPTPVPSA